MTEPFNKAVAEELANTSIPKLPGKTLVFSVGDAHAGIVVDQMKRAFRTAYGDIE